MSYRLVGRILYYLFTYKQKDEQFAMHNHKHLVQFLKSCNVLVFYKELAQK